MIQIKKSYVLELTEEQARKLYLLLRTEKGEGNLTPGDELVPVHNELKKLFDTGIK